METDVLIIGAGVSGLVSACLLKQEGQTVVLVEARDRVGGRIYTVRSSSGEPVELGAEFVHGLPPETLNWLDPSSDLETREGEMLIYQDGRLTSSPHYFENVSGVLSHLSRPLSHDLSFKDWLSQIKINDSKVEDSVLEYIQGYHAADVSEISVEALQEIEKESDEYDAVAGAFFFRGGQSKFIQRLVQRLDQSILLGHCVKEIRWSTEGVHVYFADRGLKPIRAKKLLITVPVGVLQASPEEGGIRFYPELPSEKLKQLSFLKMGAAIRATYVFREAPWKNRIDLPAFSMIFDPYATSDFRLWWGRGEHQITGWLAGPMDQIGKDYSHKEGKQLGLESLGRIFDISIEELNQSLESFRTYNWNKDPFSRGSYAYIKVGGKQAQRMFSEPISSVLFFAGDATCPGGFFGTINGAIKSAVRVVQEIVNETAKS